jgi:predicted hydrocarbon binding protein
VIFVADIRATSSGNTTPLGAGEGTSFTARDFRDTNAKMISQTIARENYRSKGMSNAKLSELRKYVFKMVTGWTNDTKMRIISEYGDMSQLRSSNPEEVNRQVTETLIINLKPEDAEILLRDIKINERKIFKDVTTIQNSRTKLADGYRRLSRFSAKTLTDIAKDIGASYRVNKIRRELRRFDVTFKIPKNVISQFKKLRKELIDVLNELYNRVELNNLALNMDINVPERITQRQLRNLIINKTLLYVSLIVGKSRKSYANAFLSTRFFDELLRYTSYSYITGQPPISEAEIIEKMKNAAKAKAIFKSKKAPDKAGYAAVRNIKINKGINNDGILNAAGSVIGRAGSKVARNVGKFGSGLAAGAGAVAKEMMWLTGIPALSDAINKLRTNITEQNKKRADYQVALSGKSSDELLRLSRMSGLSAEDATPEEIARAQAKSDTKKSKLTSKIAKLDSKKAYWDSVTKKNYDPTWYDNKNTNMLQDFSGFVKSSFSRSRSDGLGKKSAELADKVGLAKKREDIVKGKTQEMGTEIPYVKIGDTGLETKDITKAVPVYVINEWMKQRAAKSDETGAANTELEKLNKEYDKTGKGLFGGGLFGGLLGGKKRKELGKKITDLEYQKMTSLDNEISSESGADSGSFWDKMTIDIGSKAVDKLEDNHAVKVYDMSSLRLKRDQEKNAITAGFVISDYAKSSGLDKIKKELATPVFVVNKQESIKELLVNVLGKIPVFGEIANALVAENAGELVDSLTGLSTGGRGRYVGGNKTSQFISGDSRNKSPNPEQVSINWDKKTYNVKPIPQFADGGSQRATSGQVTRMTAGERNIPMSVGISSHTITYNRSLGKDVKDNGSNEALKVYSVNPGLSDLLEVNGKSVSAIGLMSDMTDRLSRIEGLLAIGNEQRNAVATATAATAALIPKLANKSGGSNPFAGGGFTSELDDILKGR